MAQTRAGNAPIPGFHGTETQHEMLAQRGMEGPNALQLMRAIERQPKDTLELSDADLADTVTVLCMVDTMPWTHEAPLRLGEEAIVPRKVAERMERAMQVRVVGGKT